jgi:hypothetical protein
LAECVPKISDDRRYAPATVRNRDLILEILRDVLPMTGVILEIASGSGEQVVHCARNLPSLVFIALGALHSVWPIASADGIICINMIHISPWEATVGLIKGAAAILPPASPFYLHGPFKREGFAMVPSNQAFDRSLRDRNPIWGLPDLEAFAMARGRTRQPEDSTSADGRTAMESAMSRGFAV